MAKLSSIFSSMDFKKVFNIFLLFLLAVYALDIYSFVAIAMDVPLAERHFSNIFFAYIAVFFILLFLARVFDKRGGVYKVFLVVCFIPITLANAVILSYLIYYHSPLTVLDFQTILDTNPNETIEFMKQMFSYKIFIIGLILAIPFIIIYFLKPVSLKPISINIFIIVCALVITGFTYDKRWVKRQISYLYVYDTYVQTKKDKEDFFNLLQQHDAQKADYSPITDLLNHNESQTFVVVIGESQNRLHNSLYGYKRNTSPKLKSIDDELYVFNNVIAPYVYTGAVMQKVVTFAGNSLDLSAYSYKNIIDFFKKAGFKTYWLSNQYYLGEGDSTYSAIAYRADEALFLNQISGFFLETTNYDGSLLEPFSKALQEPEKKKIIFVHLIGSHAPFAGRYPSDFGSFTTTKSFDIDKKKILTGYSKEGLINSYDNSIEYTDFVLDGFIAKLKEVNNESFLLFFSDHGVDVFDTDPDKDLPRSNSFLTKSMLEIPFVLWVSDKYKKNYSDYVDNFDKLDITSRPYQTNLVINSIIDLSRQESSDANFEYSVFSDKFVPQVRTVDGINYDETTGLRLK